MWKSFCSKFVENKPALKRLIFFITLIFTASGQISAQHKFLINGVVVESDSLTAMPYVYVINLKTGNGTITDYNGRYTITGTNTDTLMFSFVGYQRKRVQILKIPNLTDSTKKFFKVTLQSTAYNLNTMNVTEFKISPTERDYMKRVLSSPSVHGINAITSPISFFYEQFSRKGKERRKLQEIFENIFIQEQVNKKINPEILRNLTGDDNIDYDRFRRFCYSLTDEFILTHDGYDLYEPVMYCYKRWKREGGVPKLANETYIEKNIPPQLPVKKPDVPEYVPPKKLSTYEMTLFLWNWVDVLTGFESK